MKKALELTTYPAPERCAAYPDCPIEFHEVGNWGPDKRLSDAEAAAEYWQHSQHLLHGQVTSGKKPRPVFLKRVVTLKRFATLPHYDEGTEVNEEAEVLERVAREELARYDNQPRT